MSPRPGGILAEIVERTRADVAARRTRVSPGTLREAAHRRAAGRIDLAAALRRPAGEEPRFLCEIKKASPSRGVLREDLDPRAQAALYREHGAAGISVVTEPHYFRGDPAFLDAARDGAGALPLLRKDFHVDELQVLETAAGAADALLLLASVLDAVQLRDFLQVADEFALGHLVEVNDTGEAETALRAGARVIGVNNRDLATFSVDLARTEKVLPALRGTGTVCVAESGIHERAAVERLAAAGVDAFLVGEALVTADDPGAMLARLRGEAPSA